MTAVPGAAPRGRLLRKYVVVFVGLVGGVLMASSLVELYFAYQQTKTVIVREERATAVATAAKIEEFTRDIERRVREISQAASDDPAAAQLGLGKLPFRGELGAALAEQRELDFLRLLRDVPAISELSHLDVSGKEQLRVARLALDAVASQEDFSQAPKFRETRAGKTYWSPVYFRSGVQPYLTLAVPVGQYAVEVTTAEISLKPVQRAIAQVQAGRGGYAYVVDSRGRLFAHPDIGLVRQNRDLSALPQVSEARVAPTASEEAATVTEGLGGGQILAAHARIPSLGWVVVVERPLADAFAPLRAPIVRSSIIFVLGLGLSILASVLLARRMVAPIRILQEGASRIGAGELGHRVHVGTGDELEALGNELNRTAGQLEESYATLENRVEERTRELAQANAGLTEALEQQTATGEILRVISRSPTDVQPVFDTIARSAARLCEAEFSFVFRYDGEQLHFISDHGLTPAGHDAIRQAWPRPADRGTTAGRAVLDREVSIIPDVHADPGYVLGPMAEVAAFRSTAGVPMMRDGLPVGAITISRARPGPFPDRQIGLLRTFADQAVIAIENVRLFTEVEARNRDLTEALERQTATSEVLKVISRSAFDLQPVLEVLAENGTRLCSADWALFYRFDGRVLRVIANHGAPPRLLEWLSTGGQGAELAPDRTSVTGRAAVELRTVHVPDVLADPEYETRVAQHHGGYRAGLGVPMLRDGSLVGVFFLARSEPRAFERDEIELVTTFADQAVIAIENVRLFQELEARNRDLTETLEQQTATGEILRVISSSPTDAQPVFDTIARNAVRLCDAAFAFVFRFDGTLMHVMAHHNLPETALDALGRQWPMRPDPRSVPARAILERRVVHVEDVLAEPDHPYLATSRALGIRTMLTVPMMREGQPIGAIAVYRQQVHAFSEQQIALVGTFADQAVIAVENVRLFGELEVRNRDLTETLEQQTATGEILRVISSSPTNVQPVFDTIADSARRLCDAEVAAVFQYDGQFLHFVAHQGMSSEGVEATRRAFPSEADPGSAAGRAVLGSAVVQIPDVQADPAYTFSRIARAAAYRSIAAVPMVRDGAPVGAITVRRMETGIFSARQIDLLKTFADQAVIAIENVRLFKELETRNRDLTETLEQQTATGEILRVISGSPTDSLPVFETIARRARRLCDAESCQVFRFEEGQVHFVAHDGHRPEALEVAHRAYPRPPDRGTCSGRAILTAGVVEIPDVQVDPEYTLGDVARAMAYRGIVGVPMLREGQPIGVICVNREEPGRFTDRQIEVLKTFADQGVIAVENVRLFQALEARNRDLTETLEQQTATGEVLRVISASPTDVQPVFDTIARNAARLCEAQFCFVYRYDGRLLHFVAHHGVSREGAETVRRAFPAPPSRGSAAARAVIERDVAQIPDVLADPDFALATTATVAGYRSAIAVPMLRDGVPIGSIAVARSQAGLLPDRQVDLLKTFADQAVIAIENVRLFQELETRTQELTRSVGELKALGEVSQAVSSTLDLDTVLATIVARAVELSGSYSGIIYEFDESTQTFGARASHNLTPEYLAVLRASPIHLGEGAMGRAGALREPVEVSDVRDEGQAVAPQVRTLIARQGIRSFLAVPLVREDKLLGGLVVLRRELGRFSAGVVATLQTFAAQSVLAINNAGLFREIQRQKQYSEALVQTSPVAIVTMDLGGEVTGWNPGAERLFGYSTAEALGRPMEELVATPEVRDDVRANIEQTLGGEWIRKIGRRARKDGTLVDVEISSMPVEVDGIRVGMIAIYHDITELLRARREAEAANEAKSAFLATMSHEIRTPLNAVIGMSGLLLNTPLADEQREYAEIVRQSGDALLTVINDILDFSKIEAGRLELEAQPFDLRDCVEGALDLVATRAAEKGLDLAYLVADGTPAAIVGDVTRLRQVLLNLLSNAVKFTERGEIVLSVAAQRLPGPEALHELTFSVRDTGIGIPADRIGRLFQSFSQVDASTTRRYGGTGLGLAISQRLTELMGGRISVTSKVGVGSEFRFAIRAPAAAEVPAQAHRDLSGVQPALSGKRVLVVDDNATNRRIVTTHLGNWGLPARATESPREALRWIQTGERFDVAILDMHMPEMDGVALARAIRQEPGGEALPLILFTSLGRREARAEDEGFAAYLHKPIKPSQLFDALASILADQPVHVPQRGVGRSELDPDMAARHPLRILLAEDNVVNQKVALRLLGQLGYRADLAANGLEAIDAVERQAYDVVLMDVQMPELDGFEASREINRRWSRAQRPRIVAMTANAMQGDRELCFAAGMDDYVAKPIRVEELVAALERSTRRLDGPARVGPAAPSAGDGGAAPRSPAAPRDGDATLPDAIDRAAFDRLVASMGGGFVTELVDTFIEDARDLGISLRKALAGADIDTFRRAAHSLKSTGETVGATRLAALARELEAQARGGSLDGVASRLDRLDGEYERAARALGELRRDLRG